MGLHTRKQFAELIGLDYEDKNVRATFSMWVKRGNLIIKDDLIDDTDPQNSYWIEKQKSKVPKVLKVEPQPVEEKKIIPSDGPSQEKKNKKAVDHGVSSAGKSRHELDIEKKELEIEKLKVDTRLQELKEEKIRGEIIPIGLVKQLFNTFSQAVLTANKDGFDYHLINISKEARLTGDQLAKFRGQTVQMLNENVEKAIKITQKSLKSLVDEFSIKKEVGEHE
jgi:hypothetical protein